jgi:hypothetical protein
MSTETGSAEKRSLATASLDAFLKSIAEVSSSFSRTSATAATLKARSRYFWNFCGASSSPVVQLDLSRRQLQ